MKILILMLVFMVAAPPVQAGVCDMEQSRDSTHHAGMQHDGQDRSDHDCCDSPGQDSGENCDGTGPCGHCGIATPAAALDSMRFDAAWDRVRVDIPAEDRLAARHSSPPYRPPISC